MSANDRYFLNPVYDSFLRDAQGKLEGAARGGIQGTVEPDKLKPGETIYRIGHSTSSDDVNISSPWWMRSQTFYEIAARADRHEIDFQDLFRHKAAVATTFGVADMVLKATVQQQVRVLTGRGRPVIDVDEKTKEITGSWQGGLEITQVYVPGLREDPGRDFRRPSSIYNTLIKVVMKVPVSDYMKKNWANRANGPF
jgi:hypothetical protein